MKRLMLTMAMLWTVVMLWSCGYAVYPGLQSHPMVQGRAASAYQYDAFRARRMAISQPDFLAGAVTVDLTPNRHSGVWMAGYMPNKRSTDIFTPITGRIAYLDDGRHAVVLVSLDFVGLLKSDIDYIRSLVSARFPHEIIIMSTHTHSGPDTMGIWGRSAFWVIPVESGRDEGYMQRVYRTVADGIVMAQQQAQPAILKVGTSEGPVGYCDNWHLGGHGDNRIAALAGIGKHSGTPIFTFTNWACHAEFLGEHATSLSADYPAFYYQRTESLMGGTAIYANGAVGGLMTAKIDFERKSLPVHLRKRMAQSLGYELAQRVSDSLSTANVIDSPEITHRFEEIGMPVENDLFIKFFSLGVLGRPMFNMEGDQRPYINTELHAVNIGPLSITTVPGEIFPSLGFGIKDTLMKGQIGMVLGLANDELGYIMLPGEWPLDLYSYEITMSLGPQTGRLLWESAARLWNQAGADLPPFPTGEGIQAGR